ncbi:hypothetical protein H7F43_16300, partial [Streptococcus sp. SPC0]|nr:hypothetical protein [Streptococcus sp. SPC0]
IYLEDYDSPIPNMRENDEEMVYDLDDDVDDSDIENVDFTPKTTLVYKLPTIDLFAPDKPKNQSKEKDLVRKNIRVLEE